MLISYSSYLVSGCLYWFCSYLLLSYLLLVIVILLDLTFFAVALTRSYLFILALSLQKRGKQRTSDCQLLGGTEY